MQQRPIVMGKNTLFALRNNRPHAMCLILSEKQRGEVEEALNEIASVYEAIRRARVVPLETVEKFV